MGEKWKRRAVFFQASLFLLLGALLLYICYQGLLSINSSMSHQGGGASAPRDSFPEVQGMQADEAVAHIKKQWPAADVRKMEKGQLWSRDLVFNRVRLAVDENGIVTNTGAVG